jgi:hypothetical protein
VAACPAQVISGAHFSNQQILAEIEGALWDVLSRPGDPASVAPAEAETLAEASK